MGPAVATVAGAIIALIAALIVQVRTATAARAQARADLQRDALAALIALAEMLADDVRELRNAHRLDDVVRRDAVWPRYLQHWSEFVGVIARVRLHGPPEVRERAWAFHNSWTAGLGDFADKLKSQETISDKRWNEATKAAESEREEFTELAIQIMDSSQRRRKDQ